MHDHICLGHMRLALILRHAVGNGASDQSIMLDAKELILAARKLERIRDGQDAGDPAYILRRIRAVLTTYDLAPGYDGQTLSLDGRTMAFEVPT